MEGTNKAHENGEAMGLVGVRLTAQLGRGTKALRCIYSTSLNRTGLTVLMCARAASKLMLEPGTTVRNR